MVHEKNTICKYELRSMTEYIITFILYVYVGIKISEVVTDIKIAKGKKL